MNRASAAFSSWLHRNTNELNLVFALANREVITSLSKVQYFTIAEDGLKQSWHGRIWCNPPYGRQVHAWLEKGLDGYQLGTIDCAIFLLNRTGAAWYKTLTRQVTAICEVERRISFLDATGTPQGSPRYYNDFIYLGRDPKRFKQVYSVVGDVVIKGNR